MNDTGVDVNIFQFDYYMQWAAFFINSNGHVYARYGMRPSKKNQNESMMSLAGLRGVMRKVLEAHKTGADLKPPASTPKPAESLAKVPPDMKSGQKCMHCHHILAHGKAELPKFFNKPPDLPTPESLGMSLDIDLGNVVKSVDPAGAAGLREKDEILAANGTPIYSAADLSWILYTKPKNSPLKLDVLRGGEKKEVVLTTGN